MPSRNIIKQYAADSVYHIYNRGVEKRNIFIDQEDYSTFLNLLKRYLSNDIHTDKFGRLRQNLSKDIELLAFCLMSNHFHLLIWQIKPDAMTSLIRSVCTSYTNYFNKKYGRVGGLFQGRFKASRISSDSYYMHISRYIHLNPSEISLDPLRYTYSSIGYYSGTLQADWVKPKRILDMFTDFEDYKKFLTDYKNHKRMLEELKYELAQQ